MLSLPQNRTQRIIKKYSHRLLTKVQFDTHIWRKQSCSYYHSVLRDVTTGSLDYGDSRVIWNVDMPLTGYTASHFTKQESSFSTILQCKLHSLMLLCTLAWRLDRTAGRHPPISSGCCLMQGRTPGVNYRQRIRCIYRGLLSEVCCSDN